MTEERSGLHRVAVVSAILGFLSVLSGAIVTSGAPDFAIPHEVVAGIASIAIAVMSVWMIMKRPVPLGWIMLITLLAEGGLGSFQKSPGLAILHSLLGQILFSLTVAAAVLTSSAWAREPELVEDHGWPSLGSLGNITPFFVLIQIGLGAAFRHKALGVMPHLLGAMVVVLVILCICIFVMQQFPAHKTLRPSANSLMVIAFTQIFLGIAAFTVRTMNTKATAVVLGITSAHASVGALTLAAAVVLHMQIRRNVFPHREEEETEEVAK